MSVNLAIIVGNVGKDPEMRFLADGKAVASFSVATSEKWKDKQGGQKEQTEWHRCTAFGKVAEIAGEYLKKGSAVYVQGKIQTRKWQDKEGNDRYTTEIVVERISLLGKRDHAESSDAKPATDPTDDIPFADPYKGRITHVV